MIKLVLLMTLCLVVSVAQPLPSLPDQGSDQFSLDSLRREITKRILSDADKKEIQSCNREKTLFLKQCRIAEPGSKDLDRQINEAKLSGANPNDPAIQSLMERKFTLEKTCDDRFTVTSLGGKCRSSDQKRHVALEKALASDKSYQALLHRVRAEDSKDL